MVSSVADLERLIMAAANVQTPQEQWEATAFLNQWVQSDERAVFRALMNLLAHSQQEPAIFFALTTLHRLRLPEDERTELRQLMLWNRPSATYIENKVAVVLETLIRTDFPQRWPTAFEELSTKANPSLFLRTLGTLLEEFHTNSDEARTRVKDAMRGFANNESVLPVAQTITAQLMDAVLQVVRTDQSLSLLGLQVVKGFASWVDLSLIVQERVLSWLMESLSTTPIAVECLQEIVARGMDSSRKAELLHSTQLLARIRSRVDLDTVDVSPIEVVIEVAKFINTTGLELVPTPDGAKLLGEILDMFFRCYAYDDIDVSGAVLPLAQTVAQTLVDVDEYHNVVPQLLSVMLRQLRYPPDFQFDYEDEDEAEEEVYRTELRKLYQKLVRVAAEMCLQFLCQALANLPVPISSAPTPDIEAAVRLVYHYGEGIRPSPGLRVVMRNDTFRSILVALHQSDISAHPHREVLILYYDVAVRYAPIFKDHPELLPPVLAALTGERGIQHSHTRVRSRSCYLLLRLVKALESEMRPIVETAVNGIQTLLSNPTKYPLREDDTLYLFETIGVLLGKTGLSAVEQNRSLRLVMTPHVQSIRDTLRSADLPRDPEYFGNMLAGSIAAIMYLSKGFSKNCPPEVQTVLTEALATTIQVLETMPSHDIVRRNSVVLFQRMILCLGKQVLPHAPTLLRPLVEHFTADDGQDVSQLITQLCFKFHEAAAPVLDGILLPFLQKCHNLMPTVNDVVSPSLAMNGGGGGGGEVIPPHLQMERLGIQKMVFVVLLHIASCRATMVLVSPTNVSSLKDILRTMSDGAISVKDPVVRKTCIQFFRELCSQWVDKINGSDNSPEAIFLRYTLEEFIPGICQSLRAENCRDAMLARAVAELAYLFLSIKTFRVKEFERHVLDGALAGTSPVHRKAILAASDAKQMSRCLQAVFDN